jgi:uncharacterized protein
LKSVKLRRRLRGLAATTAAAMLLVACGGDGNGNGAAEGEGDVTEEGAADEEVFLSVATGGTGGTYYPYGGALASLWNRELDNVTASAEATGASVENARLIHSGEAQVALIQADAAFFALEGTEDFDEPQDLRTIAWMYPNFIQLVALQGSGIETFDDFAGQRVAVGDAGSAAELGMRLVTEALGATYDDFDAVQRIGFTEMTSAFRNNQIDVGNYVGSLGLGAIQDLASTESIQIIAFSEEEMQTISEQAPFMTSGVIPGGTYPGQDDDVEYVPSLANFVMVNTNMDRQLVYELTKSLYEGQQALEDAHPEGANTLPERMPEENAFVPIHPGALDYFEEIGIEIPEELYPDEWDG